MNPKTILMVVLPIVVLLPACAKRDSDAQPSLEVLNPASGGQLILIPTGDFQMGRGNGRPDETPHTVTVSAFYMDCYPVSQELYEKVMGTNPSKRIAEHNPVERTQWTEAVRFCNKCSELDSLTPCYNLETWGCDFAANGYRLPTEAEWEYACRAGGQGEYSFGDDVANLSKYAWFKPHSRGRPRPVGQKRPNRWGLFDMHGNVWQWCNDYYGETYYADSPRVNPHGPDSGKKRVLRGGAWNVSADRCTASYRFHEFPVFTDACFGSDSYGFRRARNAEMSIEELDNPDQQVRRVPVATPSQKQELVGDGISPDKAEPNSTASGSALSTQAARTTTLTNPNTVTKPKSTVHPVIESKRLQGSIVFVSDRSGALNIWQMRPDGTGPKPLTDDAHSDADPRFSPDGKRVLYTSLRGGFPKVWVMNRDGSQAQQVTEGSQAAWSPDGNSIIFIRDNQAYIRQLDSGSERLLTPAAWQRCGVPTWKPDGKHIAVASRHLQDIGIFIWTADGQSHQQLQTEDPCCTPQWSRDGARILFQTVKGHIHQIDIENESEEQLTFGADIQHDARYSPDGSMIVFCRAPSPDGPWQICITDLESEELDFVQITQKGSNRLPDWHASEAP